MHVIAVVSPKSRKGEGGGEGVAYNLIFHDIKVKHSNNHIKGKQVRGEGGETLNRHV